MGKTPTYTEQYEALKAKAAQDKNRFAELEQERGRVAGRIARAKGPLIAYWEELEAGTADRDDELETKLIAAVREVEASVTMTPRVLDGRVTDIDAVDDQVEARISAAYERAQKSEQDIETFRRQYLAELTAEWLDRAIAAGKHRDAMANAFLEAEGAVRGVERFGIHELGYPVDAFPPHPIAGYEVRPEAFGEIPAPAVLLVDEEGSSKRRAAALEPSPAAPSEQEDRQLADGGV